MLAVWLAQTVNNATKCLFISKLIGIVLLIRYCRGNCFVRDAWRREGIKECLDLGIYLICDLFIYYYCNKFAVNILSVDNFIININLATIK